MTEQVPEPPSVMDQIMHGIGKKQEPVRDLLTLEGIKGKTVLKDSYEQLLISRMLFLSNQFLNPQRTTEGKVILQDRVIYDFLEDYIELAVSVGGRSREDFVKVHSNEPPDILQRQDPNTQLGQRKV